MEIDSQELKKYITSVLDAVRSGIAEKNFHLNGTINFELAVTNVAEGGGGFKIYVVSAEGKNKSEQISKIEFKVSPTLPQQFRSSANQYRPNPAR